MTSLHPGSRGKPTKVHFRISKSAVDAPLAAAAAVYVREDCNEITTLQGRGYIEASCLHGCFLAAEAMEAATSVAIVIWASRLRS